MTLCVNSINTKYYVPGIKTMIRSWSQSESYFAAERRMNNSQRNSLWKIPLMQLSNIQEVSGNTFHIRLRTGGLLTVTVPPPPTSPLPVTNAAYQRCLERLSPTWCPALFRHSVRHRLCHNPSLGVTYVCVSLCVCVFSRLWFGLRWRWKMWKLHENQVLPRLSGYQEPNPNTQLQTANQSSSI